MLPIETGSLGDERTPTPPKETVVTISHDGVSFNLRLGRRRVADSETESRFLKWAIPGFLALNPYWRGAKEEDIIERIKDRDFYQTSDRLAFGFLGVAVSDIGFKKYSGKDISLSDENIGNAFREVVDSEAEVSWINPSFYIAQVQPWCNELWFYNRDWEAEELYNHIALAVSERMSTSASPMEEEVNRDKSLAYWPAIASHMIVYSRNIGMVKVAELWEKRYEKFRKDQISIDFATLKKVFSNEELLGLASQVEDLCGLKLEVN